MDFFLLHLESTFTSIQKTNIVYLHKMWDCQIINQTINHYEI